MFGSKVNRLGGGKQNIFEPTRLFRDSEGFYNDIQTYSTSYFTDTAGTDPAVLEDTIGLVLDQSQGLVLGPELVVNGTFDTSASWNVSAQSSITGGVARVVSTDGSFQNIAQSRTLQAGLYELSIDIVAVAAGALQVAFTGGGVSARVIASTPGTYKRFLNVTTTASSSLDFFRFGVTDVTFDNVSLKRISGNHLTQATAGARPKLSARYNLLLNTGFDGAASGTPGTAPTLWGFFSSGGTTVFTPGDALSGGASLRYSATDNRHYSATAPPLPSSAVCFFTVDVEVFTGVVLNQALTLLGSGFSGVSYILNGVVTNPNLPIPDGLNTIGLSFTTGTPPSITFRMGIGVNGAATGDIVFRNPKVLTAIDTDQPAYQRVTTATDYDSEGFDPYLQFDQVDDALTATIPAITGGTLVLATRQGIWIDDDINASAGTFSIGPTTYTGGPVGLFSNTGSKLIGPPLLIDRQLTISELNAQIQFYKNRGAGDVFLVDFGLIFDRAGSSILDRNDDPIRVRAA